MLSGGGAPGHGTVLGGNRDTTLFFKRIGIENAVGFISIKRHGSAIVEKRVDQSRLAMVDMRDDRDVSEIRICNGGV